MTPPGAPGWPVYGAVPQPSVLLRLLGLEPLSDWPGGVVYALACVMALVALLVFDALTPSNVTLGSLALIVVMAAALRLSPRLIVVIVAVAVTSRLVAASTGGVPWVTGVGQAIAMLAVGGVGYLAASGLRASGSLAELREDLLSRRSAELSRLLDTAQALAQLTDLRVLADRIVRSTASILGSSQSVGGRRAAFVAIEGDRAIRVAAYDEAGAEDGQAELPLAEHGPMLDLMETRRAAAYRASSTQGALRAVYDRLEIKTVAFAPVCIGDQVVGGLSFSSREGYDFVADDLRLLQAMADLAGFAMHRARLLREADATTGRLRMALDVASDLGTSLELRDVIDRLLKRAVDAVDADRCTLSTLEGDEIIVEATYDRSGSQTWSGLRYPRAMVERQPLVRQALESRKPMIGGGLEAESAAPEFRDHLRPVQHTAIVPLALGGEVRAMLVFSRRSDRAFETDDLLTLQLFGNVAVLALRNARLFGDVAVAREAADRNARRVRTVLEVGVDLAAAADPRQLVRRLLERTTSAVESDRATLLRVVDDALVVEGSRRLTGTPTPEGSRFPIAGQPEILEAIRKREPIFTAHPDFSHLPPSLRQATEAVQHSAVIPLASQGGVEDLLAISRERDVPFDDDDIAMLRLLGNVAGLALRNARLLQEAQQASRAKTDFLNMAGHELRTPVAVIKGYLSMIQDGTFGTPSETWRRPVEIVAAKVVELDTLVNEVLTASRLESGGLRITLESIDPVAMVREAVQRAQPRADLLKGRISVREPDRPVQVRSDAEHLARILDNLVNNALTYSEGPPEVTIGVADGSSVHITVEDQGVGIPDEFRERIFERFYRIDLPGQARQGGTGLGLYIGRELAGRLGGTLTLTRSEVGKGSLFTLELPVFDEPSAESVAPTRTHALS